MINIKKADAVVASYIEKLILASAPENPMWNRENALFSKSAKWNYIDGCMIRALIMLYDFFGDERMFSYAMHFTDFYVDERGKISSMNLDDFNLDNINGGKNLIYLYQKTLNEKYKLAFEKLYEQQLKIQPRLSCGNFFHKAIYPYQLWLDGTYMSLPFLAEYALLYNKKEILSDIINQLMNIQKIMRDEETGLYYHGYDEKRLSCWSNKKTGLSSEFWLRAIGWLCAALVDICEITQYKAQNLFIISNNMMTDIFAALSAYITPENMLCQLPVKTELYKNYPETSGTLLFSYSLLKAYRLGIGTEKNKTDGIRMLSAVTDNFIAFNSEELPVLKNICLVAGLGGFNKRSGTAEYYLNESIVENDAKGIAPYLMAYTEMKRITVQ